MQMLLYRELWQEHILEDVVYLVDNYDDNNWDSFQKRDFLFQISARLIEFAGSHGFYGNIWHCYLTHLIINSENIYSMPCEMVGEVSGSVNEAALHDFKIFLSLFNYDLKSIFESLDMAHLKMILEFEGDDKRSLVYNARIRDNICQTAKKLGAAEDEYKVREIVSTFYKNYGVGKFGLHKAFRVTEGDGKVDFVPVLNVAHVYLDDLVGYEIPKQKLIDNTEAFIEGRKANNCLLFGDAGTGKSSCMKGILNEYYDNGLRMIEVYRHQFHLLHSIIEQIKDRHYRFIIYMDDLSFEEFETEYKYLKAVIEGGLEDRPENVLIYATSNRRHLIRENFKDKADRDEDMHTSDTVQEKLSLANRFGVTIFFSSPDRKEFQNIVKVLAKRHGITMSEEELLYEANKWEMAHGGLSGRTAVQFIHYILGRV